MDIRAEKTDAGWTLMKGTKAVSVSGEATWKTLADLDAVLHARGLVLDRSTKDVRPRRPAGRPRKYTPEEAAQRRREQAERYRKERKEKAPDKVAKEGKRWRERTPEKQREYHKKAYQKKKARLQQDPEYRARINAYQREYQRARRQEEN